MKVSELGAWKVTRPAMVRATRTETRHDPDVLDPPSYADYLIANYGPPMRRAVIRARNRYAALKRQHLGISRSRIAYARRRR